jgi:hypothetical protein
MSDAIQALLPAHRGATSPGPPTVSPPGWDLDHITFHDVLSALNPLQYLPVVGTIYREVTGDEVPLALRMVVGTAASLLLGGPVGLAATLVEGAITEVAESRSTPSKVGWSEAAWAYHRAARAA